MGHHTIVIATLSGGLTPRKLAEAAIESSRTAAMLFFILLGAIILSIASVVEGGVYGLTQSIIPGLTSMELAAALLIGVMNLVMGVILAILSIYVAISILDKMTVNIDEFKELKRGNVAIAIIMAAVLLSVSFVIRGAVVSMASMLSPQSVASALGWA